MAKDKVDKVKSSKLFRGWDILVYVLLLILILVLLWAFIWRNPKSDINGVEILIKDEIVYSYDFNSNKGIINSKLLDISESEDTINIIVYIDEDKKHFNNVVINKKDKQAYIEDANCSSTKDCTIMKPITKNGENIICVPHQLILRATGEPEIKDPISG